MSAQSDATRAGDAVRQFFQTAIPNCARQLNPIPRKAFEKRANGAGSDSKKMLISRALNEREIKIIQTAAAREFDRWINDREVDINPRSAHLAGYLAGLRTSVTRLKFEAQK